MEIREGRPTGRSGSLCMHTAQRFEKETDSMTTCRREWSSCSEAGEVCQVVLIECRKTGFAMTSNMGRLRHDDI